jgi:ubiquinone/menaquinone biosynthesis C-methylase UbiE
LVLVANQSVERVRSYYQARGESEWHRLALPFDGAIERELHRRTLERLLPAGARVLDLGGGPGRWTIWLADRGHTVVLADLSPAMLEIARREIAAAGVEDCVDAVVEADARDLSRWPAESFDAVLALGPFYHLVAAADRVRAARECRRVLRPRGWLFAAVMPRYVSLIQQVLTWGSRATTATRTALRDGRYRAAEASAFTEAYLFRAEEVAPFFEGQGFQTERLVASEGFLALVQDQVAELQERDEAAYETLLEMAADTAADPSILGLSAHLLYVGRA